MEVIQHTMPIIVDGVHVCIRIREIIGECKKNANTPLNDREDDYYDDDSGFEINPPDHDYRGGGSWIQDEGDKSDDDDSMENESLARSEFSNVRHVGSSKNTITRKDSYNDQLCEGQTTALVTPQRSKPEHSHSLHFVSDTQFKVISPSAQKSEVGHLSEVEKTLVLPENASGEASSWHQHSELQEKNHSCNTSSSNTNSNSTSSSQPPVSNNDSNIIRCNKRIINDTQSNSTTSSSPESVNEIITAVEVGSLLGYDLVGKENDISTIIHENGDFNEARHEPERLGTIFCKRGATLFNGFINDTGLIDLSMGGCNSSFIALVPKVQDPLHVSDFRPISLIGCQYKVIAKVLANRLLQVANSIVSEVQSAYIKGRQIIDGPLMVNEIINWASKKNKHLFLFKVDFEKDFDSLDWRFLDHTMDQMGFILKWRNWIKGCLNSTFGSVIVNGSPTKEFKINKGLRQGLPIGTNMNKVCNWKPIIDKFHNRLSTWKVKTLSYGGRLTLIKSVLGALAWKNVCSPSTSGGLGIGSLQASNLAMLTKWWWQFYTEPDALWHHVITSIYGSKGGLDLTSHSHIRGPWKSIIDLRSYLLNFNLDLQYVFMRKVSYKNESGYSRYGLKLDSLSWDDALETAQHLFIDCTIARNLWVMIQK
ncbi:RNA-directed DNA polymerase, eukaryota, reverse transcriptase zinc-binding domain protein [Tanacetum coccineum]